MPDHVEQAAWDLVAMHGLRDGTATVMTSCEGIMVWLSPDAPRIDLPDAVGDVPVRVGKRPAFVRSECSDNASRLVVDVPEDDETGGGGHAEEPDRPVPHGAEGSRGGP